MKLADWANVAEISSAVAVVASLIYVGFEISQNTAAVKASTHQSFIAYGRDHSEMLISNPDIARLVATGEIDLKLLTPLEHGRFYEYTTWRMSMWEMSFLNYEAGLVDVEMFQAIDGYFALLLKDKPGYQQYWKDTRAQWDVRFMDHVDTLSVPE